MTFVYQNVAKHTVNTLEWETHKRTVEEAWADALAFLGFRDSIEIDEFNNPFEMLLVFDGLCKRREESVPLRKATPEEMKKLEGRN
jgi:hypothetical protein